MIDSNQVNALMAQQQQQQQMLGMGAPSAVVGQSQYPPQFNFGQSALMSGQLSASSRPLNAMASGMTGIGAGLGVAGMAAGFLPASVAGTFGLSGVAGFGASMLGLNPLSAGIMGAAAGVKALGSSMSNGLQMNANVGQMLSSANFANPLAPNGFGFSFSDQNRMTNQIIGMGSTNTFANQQDQMQMLNQFQQMGLDKGVTSMGKMIDKFKEFSKTTEEVATQLGKTVSEVTGLVTNLKGSGFYSASEVTGMSARMSAGAAYGMNMQQQQAMMQAGSAASRSMGLTGQSGALMNVNAAQAFGSAQQMGFIDERTMLDLTGTTNIADASQALGQSVGGRMATSLANNGMMQNMLAGFTKMENGQIVIDENAIAAVSSGNMSFDQLKSRASSMSGEHRGEFRTNRKKMASEFLSSEGGMGAFLGVFKNMAAERAQGGDITEEQAFKLLLEQYNVADERQAEMLFEMSQNMDSVLSNNLKNRAEQLAAEKNRAYIAKHKSFEGMKRKFGHEVEKFTSNAYIGKGMAAMDTGIDAGMNALEKAYYGVGDSTAGLYTDSSTESFRDSFLSGELDNLVLSRSGSDYLRGSGFSAGYSSRAAGARIHSLAKNHTTLKGQELFVKALGQGIDTTDLQGIDIRGRNTKDVLSTFGITGQDNLEAFNFETSYGDRDQETFLSNRGMGMLYKDDDQAYQNLMQNAKYAIAQKRGVSSLDVSDQEAQYVISQQNPDTAAALQRYLDRNNRGGSTLTTGLQDEFLQSVGAGGMFGAGTSIAGGLGMGGGVAALMLGATAATGIGAIVIGAGALAYGLYEHGEEKEFSAAMKGSAGGFMAKLNTKGKLKKFDKLMKEGMRLNGNDKEAARKYAADKMSEELGEAVSPEDVAFAQKALYRASGKSFSDRSSDSDYAGALKATKAAKAYQDAQMTADHLEAMSDSLLDEDVEGIEELQNALGGGGDNIIKDSREAMLNLARKAASGDFSYSGDNALLQQISSAGQLSKDLENFEGKSIAELDAAFGEGAGARLRKLAGVRQHGKLTKKELKEMAAQLAVSDTLKVAEGGAKAGAADTMGDEGNDEVLTATKSLVNSTAKLAVYVDNISSVLTGNETAGQKIPGIRNITKAETP